MNKAFTIRVTSKDLVPGETSVYSIRKNPSFEFENQEIAVTHVHIPYAWHSVSSALGNNRFAYTVSGTQYPVVLPDGNYSISAINDVLQGVKTANSHTATLTLTLNEVTGLVDVDIGTNMGLVVSPGFDTLIGLTAGSYISDVSGTKFPQLDAISLVNINSNVVNNTISEITYVSWNALEVVPIKNVDKQAGSIEYEPQTPNWINVLNGGYDELRISLTDQSNQAIKLLDSRVYIEMEVRAREMKNAF